MLPGGFDEVEFNLQVVADELGAIGVIGQDAADLGRGDDDDFGLLSGEEGLHLGLASQIELGEVAGDDFVVAAGLEAAHQGGSDEAGVAGEVDFLFWSHALGHGLSH